MEFCKLFTEFVIPITLFDFHLAYSSLNARLVCMALLSRMPVFKRMSLFYYNTYLPIQEIHVNDQMDRVKRIWYLSPMRAAKVQARLRIRAVSPEPSLLAHTSSESRGTLRQKARSLAQLNGWACAVEIFHDGMLEHTNSLDGAQIML